MGRKYVLRLILRTLGVGFVAYVLLTGVFLFAGFFGLWHTLGFGAIFPNLEHCKGIGGVECGKRLVPFAAVLVAVIYAFRARRPPGPPA